MMRYTYGLAFVYEMKRALDDWRFWVLRNGFVDIRSVHEQWKFCIEAELIVQRGFSVTCCEFGV